MRALLSLAGAAALFAGDWSAAQPATGASSGDPLPRFESLRYDRSYLRRGPGREFEIDWVFVSKGLPLLVIDEYRDWRRVRDPAGDVGWVSRSQLSAYRTAIVMGDGYVLRAAPDYDAIVVAPAERNAILALTYCDDSGDWCRFSAQGFEGWGAVDGVWGAAPPTEAEAFPEGRSMRRAMALAQPAETNEPPPEPEAPEASAEEPAE